MFSVPVQYPSRSKRRETEVSYAPTPTLASNASGWGFCFFHAAKSTPSLAPRACRRLGGFSFFFMLPSPLPLRAPLPCVNAPPLHAESTPPHAGSAPPLRAGSTPPHTASAPPPLRLWVDAPGLCALDRSPHTLCQRSRPCAMGQRSLPLRAGLMPSVSAHCVSPRPCAPHQRPLPLHLCAALHLHPCLCKCPLEDHFL